MFRPDINGLVDCALSIKLLTRQENTTACMSIDTMKISTRVPRVYRFVHLVRLPSADENFPLLRGTVGNENRPGIFNNDTER